MVDVERRMTSSNPAQIAGLRRLSARAAAPYTSPHSFITFSTFKHLKTLSSSPEHVPELKISSKWLGVDEYMDKIGSVLKQGGWPESEVAEMVHSGLMFQGDKNDKSGVLDSLLFNSNHFSEVLRKSGWTSRDVSDALAFDFRSSSM